MISPTERFVCRKNLSIFSETSIAIAIGIKINKVNKNDVIYFFNMYLSNILNVSLFSND